MKRTIFPEDGFHRPPSYFESKKPARFDSLSSLIPQKSNSFTDAHNNMKSQSVVEMQELMLSLKSDSLSESTELKRSNSMNSIQSAKTEVLPDEMAPIDETHDYQFHFEPSIVYIYAEIAFISYSWFYCLEDPLLPSFPFPSQTSWEPSVAQAKQTQMRMDSSTNSCPFSIKELLMSIPVETYELYMESPHPSIRRKCQESICSYKPEVEAVKLNPVF